MSGFFTIALIIAMAATLGALVLGIVSMIRGGEFHKKYGNRLMQARVMMQALALGFLALAFLAAKS